MQWKLRPPPSVEDFLPLWNGCQAAIKLLIPKSIIRLFLRSGGSESH
jgi:hypothetical protein